MIALQSLAIATVFTVRDHGSAYASLLVNLNAGEKVVAEPGSIVTYRGDVDLKIKSGGGSWFGRILAGESAWSTNIEANSDGEGAEVTLCPTAMGAVELYELKADECICLGAGSFLAADSSVEMSTRSIDMGTLFSGTGLRHLLANGPGVVAFNGHGALHVHTLAANEKLSVDNGHGACDL